MALIYLLFNLYVVIFAKRIYKRYVNPLSIYSVPWSISVAAYELKLIAYYDLSIVTWCVVFGFQLVYILGCLLAIGPNRWVVSHQLPQASNVKLKLKLKRAIVFLSGITAIGIVPGFIKLLLYYGTSLSGAVALSQQIYHDRLAENIRFFNIPYLPSVVYLALILCGIYIYRYRFELFLLLPSSLVAMSAIGTGNRYYLIFALIMLVLPMLVNVAKVPNAHIKGWKNKFLIPTVVTSIIVLFYRITVVRSSWVTVPSYASSAMERLMYIQPAIFKLYTYLASPVGVLNAFLHDPYFEFGRVTFAFVYNIAERVGIKSSDYRIARSYFVPVQSNTGTYIKDLLGDFGLPGAILFAFILGYVCSRLYLAHITMPSILVEIYLVIFFVLTIISFFSLYLSETMLWIILIVAFPTGRYLDAGTLYVNKHTLE